MWWKRFFRSRCKIRRQPSMGADGSHEAVQKRAGGEGFRPREGIAPSVIWRAPAHLRRLGTGPAKRTRTKVPAAWWVRRVPGRSYR